MVDRIVGITLELRADQFEHIWAASAQALDYPNAVFNGCLEIDEALEQGDLARAGAELDGLKADVVTMLQIGAVLHAAGRRAVVSDPDGELREWVQ